MKTYNLKYIIIGCVMFHNVCIARNDPCHPRWRLSVEEIEMITANNIQRQQNKRESSENETTIANWLWKHG